MSFYPPLQEASPTSPMKQVIEAVHSRVRWLCGLKSLKSPTKEFVDTDQHVVCAHRFHQSAKADQNTGKRITVRCPQSELRI